MASKKLNPARSREAAGLGNAHLADDTRVNSAIEALDQEDCLSVTDGLKQLGLIKPHRGAFETYVLISDRLEYVAKVGSRSEAIRVIREARNA